MINTAFSANALVMFNKGQLKALPVTMYLPVVGDENTEDLRTRLFCLMETHYEPEGRLVCLSIVEPTVLGKQTVSIRRTHRRSDPLEWCVAPRLSQYFRAGGETVRLVPNSNIEGCSV